MLANDTHFVCVVNIDNTMQTKYYTDDQKATFAVRKKSKNLQVGISETDLISLDAACQVTQKTRTQYVIEAIRNSIKEDKTEQNKSTDSILETIAISLSRLRWESENSKPVTDATQALNYLTKTIQDSKKEI